MDEITLGELAKWIAFIVALITGFKYLKKELTDTIQATVKDEHKFIKEDLDNIHKDIKEIKEDQTMLKNTTYVILSHLATNNNTKEMKKVLDKYVENAMKD